jgi:hypothetical protein
MYAAWTVRLGDLGIDSHRMQNKTIPLVLLLIQFNHKMCSDDCG